MDDSSSIHTTSNDLEQNDSIDHSRSSTTSNDLEQYGSDGIVGELSLQPIILDDELPRESIGHSQSSQTEQDENQGQEDGQEEDSLEEKWYRRRLVAVYMLTTIFLWADINLLAPNLSEIAEEFGFDDDEKDVKLGGQIALGFFLVGTPVSFLVGWLADSVSRRGLLFSITVILGEIGCFATYFTTTYAGLYVCRVITGISVGGSLPVIYSVLGDVYRANNRAAVAAVVSTGTGIGIAVGHGLAGFLGPTLGWRAPFLVVSIPSFFFALLVLLVKDPERGAKEAAKLELESERRRLARLPSDLSVKSGDHEDDAPRENCEVSSNEEEKGELSHPRISTSLQGEEEGKSESLSIVSCNHAEEVHNRSEELLSLSRQKSDEIMSHASTTHIDEDKDAARASWESTWKLIRTPTVILTLLQGAPAVLPFGVTAVYLNDYLSEDRGFTVEEATSVLIAFGAGNAIGVVLGGVLGHRLYRRDIRYPPIVMGSSLILSAVPFWFLINNVDSDTDISLVSVIGTLTGILAILPLPIERAILANVALPEDRGRANSFLGIIDDLGKGLGPVFVSLLIMAFGRRIAFSLSALGWVIGGIFALCVFFTVSQDEERVQMLVREHLLKEETARKQDHDDHDHDTAETHESFVGFERRASHHS